MARRMAVLRNVLFKQIGFNLNRGSFLSRPSFFLIALFAGIIAFIPAKKAIAPEEKVYRDLLSLDV